MNVVDVDYAVGSWSYLQRDHIHPNGKGLEKIEANVGRRLMVCTTHILIVRIQSENHPII